MPNPRHRPSQRAALLDVALDLLRDGGVPSLDSVARAGNVTKPGLMYHFPTKRALLTALVERVLDQFEQGMASMVGADPTDIDVDARMAAYLRWSTTYEHDAADLAVLSEPKLRVPMSELWAKRVDPWIRVPDELSDEHRNRANTVRLLAEGAWYAEATSIGTLTSTERLAVLDIGLALLNGERT